jgi:hypothetical protein
MNLNELDQLSLQELLRYKHSFSRGCESFHFSLAIGSKSTYINTALYYCDTEEKAKIILGLADLLHSLYLNQQSNNASTELHRIIGYDMPINFKSAPYFTLSPNREQLRLWYGPHLSVKYEHVESNGNNLFFNIATDTNLALKLTRIIQNKFEVERFEEHGSSGWIKIDQKST